MVGLGRSIKGDLMIVQEGDSCALRGQHSTALSFKFQKFSVCGNMSKILNILACLFP